jgi:excisionase family DNA binding protein
MRTDRLTELPDVLTVPECAAFLRVGKNAVYNAIRERRLRAIRVTGRRLLVPRRALELFLDDGLTGSSEQ